VTAKFVLSTHLRTGNVQKYTAQNQGEVDIMDWDDLRFFLELARTKTLTEAGRRLEVNHTTISRRIQRLERSMGEPLFNRTSAGYSLTHRGKTLLDDALAIEDLFAGVGDGIASTEDDISGRVRIGCTEGYGIGVLPRCIPELQREHPNLKIDLVVQPRPIQLSRHEADIVVTIDRPQRGEYLVTKLCDYKLRLYASSEYLARYQPVSSLLDLQCQSHRFVNYIEESRPAKDLPTIVELVQSSDVDFRSTSIISQIATVRAGGGIAVLPTYLIDESMGLVPILERSVNFRRTYWMVMPTEFKRIARTHTVWQFLKRDARDRAKQMSV